MWCHAFFVIFLWVILPDSDHILVQIHIAGQEGGAGRGEWLCTLSDQVHTVREKVLSLDHSMSSCTEACLGIPSFVRGFSPGKGVIAFEHATKTLLCKYPTITIPKHLMHPWTCFLAVCFSPSS